MAQNDAGLISGKIRELTRLIRETRLAETTGAASAPGSALNEETVALVERMAQKVRVRTRLHALASALGGVLDEIRANPDLAEGRFTFALLPGRPPKRGRRHPDAGNRPG